MDPQKSAELSEDATARIRQQLEAEQRERKISDLERRLKRIPNGAPFWSKAGPIVLSVLTLLATMVAGFALDGVSTMRGELTEALRDLAVHRLQDAHPWADKRHDEVDKRLDEMERFADVGNRWPEHRGKGNLRLIVRVAEGCLAADSDSGKALLRSAIKDAEAVAVME